MAGAIGRSIPDNRHGGAVAAAVPVLRERGVVAEGDEVVLFNTGSGLKYVGMEPLD